MKTFTRYFAGLPWEIEHEIASTKRTKHATLVSQEEIVEKFGRKSYKLVFQYDDYPTEGGVQ